MAQSHDEAVKWYRLAAAQDHAQALYNLGAYHAEGLGGAARDGDCAIRCFKRSAAKGRAHAGEVAARLEASRRRDLREVPNRRYQVSE
mmetsp:Transcript_13971/g.48487  ORF Transcript_13971/g.48487 Transcript_13971/m.48487 type:complete len:88 (+) Transcript_13971:358-621(+)